MGGREEGEGMLNALRKRMCTAVTLTSLSDGGTACLKTYNRFSSPVTPRTQEDSSVRIAALNAERDDLKALLLATLQVR